VVHIGSDIFTVTVHEVSVLQSVLPEIVAKRLSCEDEGGTLTAADVETWTSSFNTGDSHPHDVTVTILASDFPSRKWNLDERRTQIEQDLLASPLFTRGVIRVYLRIALCPISHGVITPA
jgi:hypothetical protein